MITASHNPYRWNGVKFKASYGSSRLPSIVAQIEQQLARRVGSTVCPRCPCSPDKIHSLDMSSRLTRTPSTSSWTGIKLRAAELHGEKLRFVVDPMHGAAQRHCLTALMTPPRHRLRRNPRPRAIRCLAASIPSPSSRTSPRCNRPCSRAATCAGCRRGWRRRPHRRDGPRRNLHHPAPGLRHPAVASGRRAPIDRAKSRKLFPPRSCSIRSPRDSAARCTRRSHRIQIYLRADARARHPAGRGGVRRHRHQALSAGARCHRGGPVALAEVMAWHGKSLGELVALLHRGIRRAPLRPRGSRAPSRTERARHRILRGSPADSHFGLAHRAPRKPRRHQGFSGRSRLGAGARLGHRGRCCASTPKPRARKPPRKSCAASAIWSGASEARAIPAWRPCWRRPFSPASAPPHRALR
jgi:hypothetical protein